ncbi:MAG: serine/threonine protein kinase [Deltaproteobacteria bacterium]|nr:serine/threonine protein kinase [Deltaproteobacteria bacterium]
MANFEPKQFGKYYLLEKLAVGGMAEIYKAKTFGVDGFEKLLVLKRILPHCCADKDFITMLVDEAKLSVTLSHANVVQVYDLGKVGDDYFISMEYINGVNLRDIIYRCRERNIQIPDELAAYIVSEICKGLDYAHRKTDASGQPLNIVHRDVSPQNILISYEGEVKLVDFGIAKAAMNISHTMAGILKGKIAYMSPEQALGKTIDYRADIFSSGIILYESLTGEKLFTGESQFEVLKKIRTMRIDLTKLPETVPEGLKPILAKALAYLPKERYQSASDLQIDLTKYLYTTHVDFTPQKLASLIKELFSDEISKQLERGALEQALEAQTSSINVAEEALQENLVHREDTAPTFPTKPDIEISPVVSAEQPTETGTATKKRIGEKLAMIGSVIILLAGLGFAYAKFIHPRIVSETDGISSAPAQTGTLNVFSTPPGAKIFLDGENTDLLTPSILENLTIGKKYAVKVAKDPYADFEQEVEIASAETINIEAVLEEAQGKLEISSEPSGASVFIDNEPIGKITPIAIEGLELNSDTKVKLTKQGYKDFEQTVKITSFKPQALTAKLIPATKTGTIKIVSTPAGADIFLNGRNTGLTTPATLKDIPLGEKQNIRIAKSGYQNATKTVSLKDGSPMDESFELTAATPPAAATPPPVTAAKPPAAAVKQLPPVAAKPAPAPKPAPVKETKPPATAAKEKEPAKAPEAAIDGAPASIKVQSSPSGAEVFINAEYKGTTPATISNIRPGNVGILINKEGRSRFSQKLSLKPGELLDLGTVKLGELYGTVSISSSPSRAAVIFDGEDIGTKTPVTIKKVRRDKQHEVKLILEGYEPWERSFDMSDADDKKFNVMLEK